jgi:ankyrin repeat protein
MDTTAELFQAIKQGDVGRVEALLDADPSLATARTESGISASLLAIYYGQHGIAEALLARVPEIDIFEAAAAGRVTRVADLLNANPELVNTTSADGFSPLGLAAFFGHPGIVGLLIDFGANPNAASKNPMNVRPLHSAVANRQPVLALEIARALLEAGADVNAAQHGGWTPLHQAADHNYVEVVSLLLAHGANPSARADDGRAPLDMAAERGFAEVAELLREAAARS